METSMQVSGNIHRSLHVSSMDGIGNPLGARRSKKRNGVAGSWWTTVYEQKTGADSRIQTFFGWISDSITCKKNTKIQVTPWKLTSRLGLLAGQRYHSSSGSDGHLQFENAKYEAGCELQENWKFGSRCTDFTLVQNTPVFK